MYTDSTPPITSISEVLSGLAGVREQTRLLDRGQVILAVEWAKHHPNSSAPLPTLAANTSPQDHQRTFDEICANGAISFDDDAVAQFAVAAGLSLRSGRRLILESIMLVHFLPLVWARVLRGGLDVWRARLLAGGCVGLTPAALRFVDSQMANSSVRVTEGSREALINEAKARFMPEVYASQEDEATGCRGVTIDTRLVEHGVVPIEAHLDLPDALALEAALATGAQALQSAGSDAPLQTRRAWALGDLARAATGEAPLPLYPTADQLPAPDNSVPNGSAERPHWNGTGAPTARVQLYIHLAPQSTSSAYAEPPAVVEASGLAGPHVCTPQRVREWFTRPTIAGGHAPKVSIRPTLDRSEHISSGAYQPTNVAREHVQLAHTGCVFPFCTSPAYTCDLDHTIPWKPHGAGGATCTCNLAPLCRTHHRLKTHGDNPPPGPGQHSAWKYTHLGGGEYYWEGPNSWRFITSNNGTFDANLEQPVGAPRHPALPPGPSVDLGQDWRRALSGTLIHQLLLKATLTRDHRGVDIPPVWQIPTEEIPPEESDPSTIEPPPEWDEEGNYLGPTTFISFPAPLPKPIPATIGA